MTNIIEHDSGESDVVRVGQGDGFPVSLKVYQDIYHQITGQTEEIRKRYKDSIKIETEDISQLHTKIAQVLDVHNVVAGSEIFSIFFEKDRKETFTSHEKFKSFCCNSSSAINNIIIRFEASIIPAKLKKPQQYAITIRLSNRISQLKEMKEEAPPFMQGQLAAMMVSETAEIKVEYADYVIARGFIEAFDEWIDGCPKHRTNKTLKKVQNNSHFIPSLGKLILSSMFLVFSYLSIDGIYGVEQNLNIATKFLVVCAVSLLVILYISNIVFRLIENSIDSYVEPSWIKISNGDKLAIDEYNQNNKNNILHAFYSSIIVISLGVMSSQISNLLSFLMQDSV